MADHRVQYVDQSGRVLAYSRQGWVPRVRERVSARGRLWRVTDIVDRGQHVEVVLGETGGERDG